MRFIEFEAHPNITGVFEMLPSESGRFLMEDVTAGTAIIGADPLFTLTPGPDDDAFAVLQSALGCFQSDATEDIPFAGGAVGCFSYDLGRRIEEIPTIAVEDVKTPDYCLSFYDSALCIDLRTGKCTAVSWSGDNEALRFWQALALNAPDVRRERSRPPIQGSGDAAHFRSNFTRGRYLDAIGKAKDYIAAGDIYQVNLAQRFQAELNTSPWELYKALRRINPAPKSCYLELGNLILAGASPELFLDYNPATRTVRTRPIKGTRPRGRTVEEDQRLAHELIESEKERAENIMIVDMERNDLGRVAEYGSVVVPELWRVERHPNVFQLVSTVQAKLAEEYGPVDLLRAMFPGGSITGAPKVRAMQIIEELEPHRRGLYTGSAGLIDFRGRVDLNIVIRSFVIEADTAYFHAGGGIVIDSDPEAEYQETLDKVSGLMAAIEA